LVLDASKGSLCEVVISAHVNNIIVKGNNQSYVSVVLGPAFLQQNTGFEVVTEYDGTCGHATHVQTGAIVKKFDIGSIKVGKIHTFSILGVQRGVTVGTIINHAQYFTLDQTKDLFDYGLTQGGVAGANWNHQQIRKLTSDTLIVGSFINYGHFLIKTTNLGGVQYNKHGAPHKPCKDSNVGNCVDVIGNKHCDRSICDNRTFWLINLLVKCKLTSTGRNKNFRIPLGILYLWAGADVRLCNVSCQCIKGPEPCVCYDRKCYEGDATRAPLINCIAVVCGYTEILPDNVPCSPNIGKNGHIQKNVWDKCHAEQEIGDYSGCSKSSGSDSSTECCGEDSPIHYSRVFGKNFNSLSVNPCFIKNVNLVIRNSDLIVCEVVKRVWTCPLANQLIDNASCDPHNKRPFVSTACDQSYVKTVQLDGCGNHKSINSARIYSYLMNLEATTPALYLGQNLNKDADFDLSNLRVQRLVFSQGLDQGDNGWPHSTGDADYCYALLFSKCRDDPVIDPKTTFPRRCCDLYCQYTIPDRVRPYCGLSFCPTQLQEACKPIISCEDQLNTVCTPVCPDMCDVLPSSKASGKIGRNNIILQNQCCKLPLPSNNVCLVQALPEPKHEVNNHCQIVDNKLCDDWDECTIDSKNEQPCEWDGNNNECDEWEHSNTNCEDSNTDCH
jgi:hypothetical protein